MDFKTINYDLITNESIDFHSIFDILKKVFKHNEFRNAYQKDAVNEACRYQKDLFVSLPTGSGKSLIYQLPAIHKNNGLVIVVSPLVALMSNQLLNANKLGIPAVTINSHMSKTWNQDVKNELLKKTCRIRLLYLTPETLCSDHFRYHLATLNKYKTLKLFAIDEAHCVSSWGHEFRHDYLKLANLRTECPDIPIIALTATAPPKVLNDIIEVLKLRNPKHIVAPSFRKNLFYDVRPADVLEGRKLLQDIYEFIKKCLNIKDEDELSPGLKSASDFDQLLLGKGRGRKKVIVKETAAKKSNGIDCDGSTSSKSAFVTAASLLGETKPKSKFLSSVRKSAALVSASSKRQSGSSLGGDIKQFLLKASGKPKKDDQSSINTNKIIDVIQIDDDEEDGVDESAKNEKTTSNSGKVGCSNGAFVTAASLMLGEVSKSKRTSMTTTATPVKCRKRPHSSSNGDHITTTPKQQPSGLRRKSVIGSRNHTHKSGVGIVYCRTKLNCEEVAEFLSRKGIRARPYHSSLTPKDRSETERLWMDEEILIICATISFGMGIDKANVRVVIHYNMSQSLANYYQESGRAGRDGERAYCRLYYSKSDQNAIIFLLRKNLNSDGDGEGEDCDVGGYPSDSQNNRGVDLAGATPKNGSESSSQSRYDPANWRQLLPNRKVETARNAMARFEKMVDYCRSKQKCRHLLLAKEFAIKSDISSLNSGCKDACDYCLGRPLSPQTFLENSFYD